MDFAEPLPNIEITFLTDLYDGNSSTETHHLIHSTFLSLEGTWNPFAHHRLPPEPDSSQLVPSSNCGPGWYGSLDPTDKWVHLTDVEKVHSLSMSTHYEPPAHTIMSQGDQELFSPAKDTTSLQTTTYDSSTGSSDGIRYQDTKSSSTVKKRRAGPTIKRSARYESVLRRNKVAAAKFRERKRSQVEAMKMRVETLETRHRELSAYYIVLREEAFMLKSELLTHNRCGCVLIQRYIQDAAHRVVEGSESSEWSLDTQSGEVGTAYSMVRFPDRRGSVEVC